MIYFILIKNHKNLIFIIITILLQSMMNQQKEDDKPHFPCNSSTSQFWKFIDLKKNDPADLYQYFTDEENDDLQLIQTASRTKVRPTKHQLEFFDLEAIEDNDLSTDENSEDSLSVDCEFLESDDEHVTVTKETKNPREINNEDDVSNQSVICLDD